MNKHVRNDEGGPLRERLEMQLRVYHALEHSRDLSEGERHELRTRIIALEDALAWHPDGGQPRGRITPPKK